MALRGIAELARKLTEENTYGIGVCIRCLALAAREYNGVWELGMCDGLRLMGMEMSPCDVAAREREGMKDSTGNMCDSG